MDVLPTPVEVPATTSRLAIVRLELSVPAGARGEALGTGEALAGVEGRRAELIFAAERGGKASADRLMGRAAVAANAVRWERRDRRGEGFGFAARFAARHHAVGQAHGFGFARVHGAARHDQVER